MLHPISLLSLLFFWIFLSPQLTAAFNIPINGSGHNPYHPEWGTPNRPLFRAGPAVYSDGISTPRLSVEGEPLPSAREISNIVFNHNQADLPQSHRGLTDYLTYWGQFIDHDLTFTSGDPGAHKIPLEPMFIEVPANDPFFDPTGLGDVEIPFYRGVIEPYSGVNDKFPAVPMNIITSWLDGSQIYGSTDTVANYLRNFTGGLLKENAVYPGYPPFNDDVNTPIKMQTSPAVNQSDLFLFGDVRGNENPGLAALHILFFRDHNRRARELSEANPTWTDEQIYQEARKMVIAVIHHITEEEYIPLTLGEHLPEVEEYIPNIEPNVMVEFSTGAFRYGHSEVNSYFWLNSTSDSTPDLPPVSLRNSYFNISVLLNSYDELLVGMYHQKQGAVDTAFVDDLRNFLFGAPGSGGLDLTALNTERGRDHGLPGINAFRLSFGLPAYETWSDINPDPAVWNKLQEAYDEVEDCDVYVCGLAEPPVSVVANVGETFYTVIKEQYLRTRDGDRAWYESEGYLTDDQLKEARTLFLADVIAQNTNIPKTRIPCHVMALPDGCGLHVTPPTETYDFIVTLYDNSVANPTDDLEQRFLFAINGEPVQEIQLTAGKTYTFFSQISCNHALVITEEEEFGSPAYTTGVSEGQFGCYQQNPVLTITVDNNTPTQLYYQCALHPNMGGNIKVTHTPVGPPPNLQPSSPVQNNNIGAVIGLAIVVAILVVVLFFVIIYIVRNKPQKV